MPLNGHREAYDRMADLTRKRLVPGQVSDLPPDAKILAERLNVYRVNVTTDSAVVVMPRSRFKTSYVQTSNGRWYTVPTNGLETFLGE